LVETLFNAKLIAHGPNANVVLMRRVFPPQVKIAIQDLQTIEASLVVNVFAPTQRMKKASRWLSSPIQSVEILHVALER
jgi:hypothetical protein